MTTGTKYASAVIHGCRHASRGLILRLLLVVAAVCLAITPLPGSWIERFYSDGAYPLLQSLLTPLTNKLPFSLGDLLSGLLALGLLAWWTIRIRRARGRRLRAAGSLALNTFALAALIYIAFLALWGFNYQRQPLMLKLDYDPSRLSEVAEKEFLRSTIDRMNADSKLTRGEVWPTEEEWSNGLLETFNHVVIELGNRRGISPAIPKVSLTDRFLGATGISAYTNPFGLEVVFNSDLLPVEKPFTLAHEWAHLAGFADESEANFVALLACARSEPPAIRYSGWLSAYPYLPIPEAGLDQLANGAKWEEVLPPLAPEVTADLHAIAERSRRRISPAISRMQGRVYDGFLKANRVEAGINSYGLFVRLMLGTRFEADWVPARRAGH